MPSISACTARAAAAGTLRATLLAALVSARATGEAITVPVGETTLGRIFNVLGRPIDKEGDVTADLRYPIHRPAPPFAEQSTRVEVFETGIKVIDLIAPFTKGGKTGIFGGAGVDALFGLDGNDWLFPDKDPDDTDHQEAGELVVAGRGGEGEMIE